MQEKNQIEGNDLMTLFCFVTQLNKKFNKYIIKNKTIPKVIFIVEFGACVPHHFAGIL